LIILSLLRKTQATMYKYIVGMEDAAWGGSFNFRKYA